MSKIFRAARQQQTRDRRVGAEVHQRPYDIKHDIGEVAASQLQRTRQDKALPIADALHGWMIGHRQLMVPEGSVIAKVLDYSLSANAPSARRCTDRQLDRKPDPSLGYRTIELAVRLLAERWPAGDSDRESGPIC